MERIILSNMDKLATPIEQAKIIGLLKEPEHIQTEEKQNFILLGFSIACALVTGYIIIYNIIEKNNLKKKRENI